MNGASGSPVSDNIAYGIFGSYTTVNFFSGQHTTIAAEGNYNSDGTFSISSRTPPSGDGYTNSSTVLNADGTSSQTVSVYPGACNPNIQEESASTLAAATINVNYYTNQLNNPDPGSTGPICGDLTMNDYRYIAGYPAPLPSPLSQTTIQDLGQAPLPSPCPNASNFPATAHEVETISSLTEMSGASFGALDAISSTRSSNEDLYPSVFQTTEDDYFQNNTGLVCSETTTVQTQAATRTNGGESSLFYPGEFPTFGTPPPTPQAIGLQTTTLSTDYLGLNSATLEPFAKKRFLARDGKISRLNFSVGARATERSMAIRNLYIDARMCLAVSGHRRDASCSRQVARVGDIKSALLFHRRL